MGSPEWDARGRSPAKAHREDGSARLHLVTVSVTFSFARLILISAVFKLPSKTERSMSRSVKATLKLQALIRHRYITGNFKEKQHSSVSRSWLGVRLVIYLITFSASKCYFPPSPENGIRTCSRVASVFPGSGYDYQYVCTFACDEGYQLQGAQQRSCPSNFGNKASWTHASPKCVKFTPNTGSGFNLTC